MLLCKINLSKKLNYDNLFLQFIFDKKSNQIFVRFTLLGAPTGIKGDVTHIEDQLDLDQAEQYLEASLKNHQFLVYYLQQDGKVSTNLFIISNVI